MRKWGDTGLLLPFAWIGLVGGWTVAGIFKLSNSPEDLLVRGALALVTPLVAGALGWLLGSMRLKVSGRVAAFAFGTPLAGAVNGALIGFLLSATEGHPADMPSAVLFGAAIGGVVGLFFLPALAPGFVAYLRVGRARSRSFVDRADRRALVVVTAGTGAVFAWSSWPDTDRGLVRSAIIVAGFVVGLVGLLEDGMEYTRVSAAARTTGLVPAGTRLLDGPPAPVVDFGLGEDEADVVVPAHDAYRDAPRRAATVLGDGPHARKALAATILRDGVVAAVSLLLALWR